jgi:hypothetical protein
MGNMKTLRKARNLPHKSPWPEPMNHFFFSSPTSLFLFFFFSSLRRAHYLPLQKSATSHSLMGCACVNGGGRERRWGEGKRKEERKGESIVRERERERGKKIKKLCAGNVRR